MSLAIEIKNLTKYYGKSRGVEDVSLQIREGEFFGFIGPNGAGKSTTIRSLLGLIQPSSGSIRILGKDLVTEKEVILSSVGYLPSENAFYPGMKVKDILKFSAELRKQDCTEEARRLCDALQLDVSRKAAELSYGNRKKLSIVCALQHDPSLLILDEPTGGLDPLMQRAFFDILKEKNRKGTTIFFSSHVLSEVQNNCNRTAVIRNGKIIACDEVDQLKKTQVKRVQFLGTAEIGSLEGVKNLSASADSVSFIYNGSTEELLRVLAAGQVRDLTIQEPDLEEVFLHYYEEV